MKINKILLSICFLLPTALHAAGADRFGNQSLEIPRSSWTTGNESNVLIATAGVAMSSVTSFGQEPGMIVLRSIVCSGSVASTVTVFNSMVFNGQSSTASYFSFVPGQTDSAQYASVLISSALSYQKIGLAPCLIQWDYTTAPKSVNVGIDK